MFVYKLLIGKINTKNEILTLKIFLKVSNFIICYRKCFVKS